MGWIYLALVIVLSTVLWPVVRWTLARDGNPRVMGFWVSLIASAISLAVVLIRGVPLFVPSIWIAAATFSAAYAVGFIIFIMRCLQIGPSGPTVTINNLAMIFGVLYGVLWLDPHLPNLWIVVGTTGVLTALVMIGTRSDSASTCVHPAGREWLRLVMAGGALSGLSFMTQTYMGLRHPGFDNSMLFIGIGFGLSAVILFLTVVGEPRILLRRQRELAGGIILGISSTVGLPLTILAFGKLGAEVVLPVSVTSPMVLVMVLGIVVYGERLSRLMWAGCLMAALSVGMIGYGSTRDSRPVGEEIPRCRQQPLIHLCEMDE